MNDNIILLDKILISYCLLSYLLMKIINSPVAVTTKIIINSLTYCITYIQQTDQKSSKMVQILTFVLNK